MASTLFEDSAPSASLDCLKAQAAPTHPRAQPEPLGSLRWPQELASGRPKVEDFPLSTSRLVNLLSKDADPAVLVRRSVPPADYPGRMLSARFCPICGTWRAPRTTGGSPCRRERASPSPRPPRAPMLLGPQHLRGQTLVGSRYLACNQLVMNSLYHTGRPYGSFDSLWWSVYTAIHDRDTITSGSVCNTGIVATESNQKDRTRSRGVSRKEHAGVVSTA